MVNNTFAVLMMNLLRHNHFDAKARELMGEDASGGKLKKGKKNTGNIRRLNFPTPEERARYDAAIAKLATNNKCNAGDPAVWGELAGDGFQCDADCAERTYERQDDENVQEGQIGYLCGSHNTNYRRGATPFKPARKNKPSSKPSRRGPRGPYKKKK